MRNLTLQQSAISTLAIPLLLFAILLSLTTHCTRRAQSTESGLVDAESIEGLSTSFFANGAAYLIAHDLCNNTEEEILAMKGQQFEFSTRTECPPNPVKKPYFHIQSFATIDDIRNSGEFHSPLPDDQLHELCNGIKSRLKEFTVRGHNTTLVAFNLQRDPAIQEKNLRLILQTKCAGPTPQVIMISCLAVEKGE